MFGRSQWHLTDVTEGRAGFAERGIERDPFVEHETIAFEMFATAFFEITKYFATVRTKGRVSGGGVCSPARTALNGTFAP